MTKTKKRRISKKSKKKILFSSLMICFVIGVIAGIGFSKRPVLKKKKPPAPYEEVSPDRSFLNQAIGRIDEAVYAFLTARQIPHKNIFLATLEPRHEKSHHWEFAELGVKLDQNTDLSPTAKGFEEILAKLGNNTHYRKEVISENEIAYQIFVERFHTHKIYFRVDRMQELVLSPLPRVAIIIDDVGYDAAILEDLEAIDIPLALSVLPSAPFQKEVLALAERKGWELLLHLPMEPKNYPDSNPGSNALLMHMTGDRISELVEEYLKEMPQVKGVNNHMGSAFTEDEAQMATVLTVVKKHKLFYIDSRTSSQTVAALMAEKMKIPNASRSVFLDNDLSAGAIQLQMERLLSIAEHSKQAIAIGHPHYQTVEILREYIPNLRNRIRIVPVSEMVR